MVCRRQQGDAWASHRHSMRYHKGTATPELVVTAERSQSKDCPTDPAFCENERATQQQKMLKKHVLQAQGRNQQTRIYVSFVIAAIENGMLPVNLFELSFKILAGTQ